MSHYARLKVTEDAPVEVIRAAYRVLAAKYHPDRQGSADDGTVRAHAEMSALNTAYKVLINAESRREYDRLLAERRALSKGRATSSRDDTDDFVIRVTSAEPAVTKVDMEWLAPKADVPAPSWSLSRRTLFMGGGAAGVLLFGVVYWLSQMFVQHQMERALSEQYSARPAVPVVNTPAIPVILPDPPRARVKADPASEVAVAESEGNASVTDLSRMTQEELAKTLPELRSGSFNNQTQSVRAVRP